MGLRPPRRSGGKGFFRARVVEPVDTRDLKSLGETRAGSTPAPGTTLFIRAFTVREIGETNHLNGRCAVTVLIVGGHYITVQKGLRTALVSHRLSQVVPDSLYRMLQSDQG